MSIAANIQNLKNSLHNPACQLIAVSKTKPLEALKEAYTAGQRHFGENKVQEMVDKQAQLPGDIHWHMIGHLQSNKVKYLAPFVYLIHSVDSFKLLQEINKQAEKNQRVIQCLLQVHIALEETKFGFLADETISLIQSEQLTTLSFVKIVGLMGMATNTEDQTQIQNEFRGLKQLFEQLKSSNLPANVTMKELSMGMSGDYLMAMEEGSTLVRVGSAIFGSR